MTDDRDGRAALQHDPETRAWWEACKAGALMVRHCNACDEDHFLPRSICPFCFSDDTTWKNATGDGVVYSFSIMRRAPQPYVLAYVKLAEGPKMMTNIVVDDVNDVRIGQPVRVVFRNVDGLSLPMFEPV